MELINKPKFEYLQACNENSENFKPFCKILFVAKDNIVLRQIPPEFDDTNITITFDPHSGDYDFVVVFHHSSIPTLLKFNIEKNRIIFVSMEPSDNLCNLSPDFLNQFGLIISSDSFTKNINTFKFNISTWWVGLSVKVNNKKHYISYDKTKDYSFSITIPIETVSIKS